MLRTEPINKLADNLPAQSVTVYMLDALDYVIPGEWDNITGFEAMIRDTTGESEPARLATIRQQALMLYNEPGSGYQKAMWLYQTVDQSDRVLAAAALANKVGERIGFLSFLTKLTPKSDVTQSVDLGLKLVAEALAYSFIHGLPGADLTAFQQALSRYGQASLMRMAALVCVDGLVPLGPDFVDKVNRTLRNVDASTLENNAIFQNIKGLIPGQSAAAQLGFVQNAVSSVGGWMEGFKQSHNLTPQSVTRHLQSAIAFTDDKLDYVAAFVDASTDYFRHTGTQTVARQVISQAVGK